MRIVVGTVSPCLDGILIVGALLSDVLHPGQVKLHLWVLRQQSRIQLASNLHSTGLQVLGAALQGLNGGLGQSHDDVMASLQSRNEIKSGRTGRVWV